MGTTTYGSNPILIMEYEEYKTTVNPNTLWSYFHADISVTACHIPIKLYTLPLYVKGEVWMQRFENWTC